MYAPNLLDPAPTLETLSQSNRVIVAAPPGSGKSTLLCAEIAKRYGRTIVCEPRRVAARSLAAYVSRAENRPLMDFAGYLIRFDYQSAPDTPLTYATTGVVLRMIAADPLLRGANVVIIDEFHERTIEMDVLLSLILEAQKDRPDLKLVVMSATLDIPRIQDFLKADVVDYGVSSITETANGECIFNGRHYVDILYTHSLQQAMELADTRGIGNGSILIFQPGKAEIEACGQEVLRYWKNAEIIPMHAELSQEEQDKAFLPASPGKRKVVIATNIAEASITIPDVTCVIDSGLEKVAYYNPRTHSVSLYKERISKSSAVQRAARAGRVGSGLVIRLWSKEENAHLRGARSPEILRQDLTSVILTLKRIGVDVHRVHFLDGPQEEQVQASLLTLRALGALDEDDNITALGKQMNDLPVEPRLARSILAIEGQSEALRLLIRSVALASTGSPFAYYEPSHPRAGEIFVLRDEFRRSYAHAKSDLLIGAALLSAYESDAHLVEQMHLRKKILEEALMAEQQIQRDLLGCYRPPLPPSEWDDALLNQVRYAIYKGFADRTFLPIMRTQSFYRPSLVYEPLVLDTQSEQFFPEAFAADHFLNNNTLPLIAVSIRKVRGGNLLEKITMVNPIWLAELKGANFRQYYEWENNNLVKRNIVYTRAGRSYQFKEVVTDRKEIMRAVAEMVLYTNHLWQILVEAPTKMHSAGSNLFAQLRESIAEQIRMANTDEEARMFLQHFKENLADLIDAHFSAMDEQTFQNQRERIALLIAKAYTRSKKSRTPSYSMLL